MLAEYSFFRCEGKSLTLMEVMMDARAELEDLKTRLAKRYDAGTIMGGWDEKQQRFRLTAFVFEPPAECPADWDVNNRQMSNDGKTRVATFASPAPGSKDYFNTLAYLGLMERAAKNTRLEHIFQCGEMTYKSLPAGSYSNSFVQFHTLRDVAFPKPEGNLKDGRFMTYSNSPVNSNDLLCHMNIGGDWYVRVPNIAGTEDPQFTPPDAVRMDYQDMLRLDNGEKLERFNQLRASSFGRPLP